ncbi:MAG: hypothetical protein ACREA0_16370, partial [bacterium]
LEIPFANLPEFDLDLTVGFGFTFGTLLDESLPDDEAAYFELDPIDIQLTANDLSIPDFDARVGFAGVQLADGTLDIGLGLQVNFSGARQLVAEWDADDFLGVESTGTMLAARLPVQLTLGSFSTGNLPEESRPLVELFFPDIFALDFPEIVTERAEFDFLVDLEQPVILFENFDEIFNFTNTSPLGVLAVIRQVVDILVAMRDSEVLQAEIPFTGKSLGDLLDYATTFQKQVLDPIFLSRDALQPDFNEDGIVDTSDLDFSTIHDLFDRLEDALAPLPVTIDYRQATNEIALTINFAEKFGFGEARVQTVRQGGGGANEVQRITINAVAPSAGSSLDDSFRLGFANASGMVEYTGPIARGADADTVEVALEGLSGIDAVSVEKDGDVYVVTFDGALVANRNVTQLVSDATELAGSFALDFGASLGDIAGITTNGDFSVLADLNAGLMLIIDLNPSQKIEITPPTYSPVPSVSVERPAGETSNAVQIVSVRNAS